MNWSEFLLIVGAHLAAVVSPGPDFAVVTKVATSRGASTARYTALGIACGIMVHVLYCLAGIALLIQNTAWLFNTLRIAGALYLVWVAVHAIWGAFKTVKQKKLPTVAGAKNETPISPWRAWRQGFITNVSNPKATLFFLAMFTQVIQPDTKLVIKVLYGAEMTLVTFLWFAALATLIGHKKFRSQYQKAQWAIDAVLGIVLLLLAIKILF